MKKTTFLLPLFLLLIQISFSQSIIHIENFEGIDFEGYAIGDADLGIDYPIQSFVVSGSDRISRGAVASFTFDGTLTGNATNFIGGEDIDGGFYNGHSYIELDPISITGKSNLSIDIDLAFPNTNAIRYESDDFLIVDYKIDGGSYISVLAFYGGFATPGLLRDDNLNGILEFNEVVNVNTAMTTFNLNLDAITSNVVSGNSIEIRVRFNMAGSQEEFAFDNIILKGTVANNAPIIAETTANQAVNDNSTITPFSTITTTDADGDNLSAIITLDNNAKGMLSGTGLLGSGPYTIASTTTVDLQTKLRGLLYNPTDNRTSTTETTTFTVVINDGTETATNNTTTVISSAVVPTVTSVNVPASATYVSGNNLDFAVNFNENVTVNTSGGIPQIALTIGATTRQATYQSGSGTNALLFRYSVQAGDLDNDGIAVGALATNGGTLKDSGGKNANLTLNSVGSTTSVLVDVVAPTITILSPTNNSTYIAIGNNLEITFSENVVKGTGSITIYDAADDSVVETIAVTTAVVSITDNIATINPSSDLEKSKTYYIQIAATAFKDVADNTFAGIADKTTWSFAAELKIAATLTFSDLGKTYGNADFDIEASSNSTGAISYSIVAGGTGTASLSGTNNATVTLGNAGTVTIKLTQAADVNYLVAEKEIILTITQKELTITGLTGANKTHDGTTTATATGTATLTGVINGDDVTLGGAPVFTFASSDLGTGIAMSTTGYTISGLDSTNYTLIQPNLSANITEVLGIEDLSFENSVNLFPNPVSDILYVKLNNVKIQEIKLFNVLGKKIKNVEYKNESIDFSEINAGIYLLKIKTEQGIVVKRIIRK